MPSVVSPRLLIDCAYWDYSRVNDAFLDRDERAGTGASDHAPVVVDLSDR